MRILLASKSYGYEIEINKETTVEDLLNQLQDILTSDNPTKQERQEKVELIGIVKDKCEIFDLEENTSY